MTNPVMGLTHIKNIMPKLNIPPLSRACLTVDKRNTREKVGDDDRRSHGFHTHRVTGVIPVCSSPLERDM